MRDLTAVSLFFGGTEEILVPGKSFASFLDCPGLILTFFKIAIESSSNELVIRYENELQAACVCYQVKCRFL